MTALIAVLKTDKQVTDATPLTGVGGCTKRLEGYFLDKYPLYICRHRFQACIQTPGESFKHWWIRKKSKARDCNLDGVTRAQIMELELIRGVCDPKLREWLLQEKDRDIANLVGIVDRWQQMSDMGSVLDNVQRSLELDNDVVDARKMALSAYKNRNSTKRNGERGLEGQQERPQRHDRQSVGQQERTQSECTQSGETCPQCGRKAHARDQCPAKEAICLECDKKGHFKRACRSRSPGGAAARSVRSAEVQGQGAEGRPSSSICCRTRGVPSCW